nr:MAG TPA: hypothetical protein [Bacteriophage sp.]
MTYEEAVATIINQGKEIDAINFLFNNLCADINKLYHENAEMSSCLKAIKKINKGKNEAIDALCERE